jgi:hypothetical protein
MSSITLTSELDAVNLMLSLAGEAPVTSIDSVGLGDVAIALQCLTEASRMIQERGWTFNTDLSYPLNPDATTKEIYLPFNTLRCEIVDKSAYDITIRGNRLYNRKTFGYAFDKQLLVNIVWFMPFDELPQAARQAIAIRAARVFQRRIFGDNQINGYTQEEEYAALASLQDQDCDVGDYNILFGGSYDVARILERY